MGKRKKVSGVPFQEDNVMEIRINADRIWTKMAYHKHTGMSRSTIDRMINDGRLETIRINGATLINV